MGWLGNLLGSADDGLLQNGLIGRGEIVGVDASGMTMQVMNGLVERKCTFTVTVYLDGEQPYQATCTQRVQEVYLPQLTSGQAVVTVRVDPNDHSTIALDFSTPVPEVSLPAGEGTNSAAWILANGTEANVVLVANQPLGVKSSTGDPVQALTLTIDKGAESYQVQVGNAVPNSALPLLFPGAKLKARIGEGPNDVVVDWAASAAT